MAEMRKAAVQLTAAARLFRKDRAIHRWCFFSHEQVQLRWERPTVVVWLRAWGRLACCVRKRRALLATHGRLHDRTRLLLMLRGWARLSRRQQVQLRGGQPLRWRPTPGVAGASAGWNTELFNRN